MALRIQSLVIDCHDPQKLGGFWAEVLGWKITHEDGDGDEVVIAPASGGGERVPSPEILFGKSEDAKTGKNRLHLDLRPTEQESEKRRITSLGAREVDIGQGGEATWSVLADPEGNEFCVLRARTEEDLPKA